MTAPKRIQLSRAKGWRKPEGAISVARPSRFGNPLRVYRGTVYGPDWSTVRATWGRPVVLDAWPLYVSSSSHEYAVRHAVDIYRTLLQVRLRDEPGRLREWLAPLRGRDLACWCPLDQPCHADVLLEFANVEREG